MNFFIRQGRALLLVAAVIGVFGLVGCGGDDGASSGGGGTSTYAVVVTSAGTGASGGGSYATGTTVSINAGTAPSGQRFKSWTVTGGGATLADSNSAATTFTMPANAVAVKANFETIPQTCTSAGTCKTVTIGTQTWLAENLNIETEDSWCYENSPNNCAKYGRLYTWEAAMSACELLGSGWHLPSRAEWVELAIAAGGTGTYGTGGEAGKKLKATSGWDGSSGNGTNEYGFSALPGGRRSYNDGSFYSAGNFGYWWTATEYSDGLAYFRLMDYYYDYVREGYDKDIGFSVRCVGD